MSKSLTEREEEGERERGGGRRERGLHSSASRFSSQLEGSFRASAAAGGQTGKLTLRTHLLTHWEDIEWDETGLSIQKLNREL